MKTRSSLFSMPGCGISAISFDYPGIEKEPPMPKGWFVHLPAAPRAGVAAWPALLPGFHAFLGGA